MKRMRSLTALLLSLTLTGCSAREDFESDLTATGVLLGLSAMGACAQVESLNPGYLARVLAVPGYRCSLYPKPTYSEYVEGVRPELLAMVRIAEKYRTANCEPEYDSFALNPVPTATDAGYIVDPASFPVYQWFSLVDGISELQNTLTTTWDLTDGSTARMARYEEFISFMASRIMLDTYPPPSAACQADLIALTQSFHPGWHYDAFKDTVEHSPVIFGGSCS